jgi:hypothetical protein
MGPQGQLKGHPVFIWQTGRPGSPLGGFDPETAESESSRISGQPQEKPPDALERDLGRAAHEGHAPFRQGSHDGPFHLDVPVVQTEAPGDIPVDPQMTRNGGIPRSVEEGCRAGRGDDGPELSRRLSRFVPGLDLRPTALDVPEFKGSLRRVQEPKTEGRPGFRPGRSLGRSLDGSVGYVPIDPKAVGYALEPNRPGMPVVVPTGDRPETFPVEAAFGGRSVRAGNEADVGTNALRVRGLRPKDQGVPPHADRLLPPASVGHRSQTPLPGFVRP